MSPYGAAKAAAETAVKAIALGAVIARTSLIVGDDGGSQHERLVHALAAGTAPGVLYTDNVRCPVHVTDLARALLELAAAAYCGTCHVAGPDAVSRHELGVLIARRDGLDAAALAAGRCGGTGWPGPLDVRLDSASHAGAAGGPAARGARVPGDPRAPDTGQRRKFSLLSGWRLLGAEDGGRAGAGGGGRCAYHHRL